MRKIFPDSKGTAIAATNSKPITEQQYIDLVNKVNAVEDLIDATDAEIECYKDEQATAITTCDINATNVNATDIVADTAQIDSISATTLSTPYLTSDSSNTTVNGDLVVTGCTVVKDITADDVVADSITVDNAAICNLTTDTFNPETIDTCVINANDITATCVTATEAAINNIVTNCITVQVDNVTEANITTANVSCAVVQEETVQTSTIDCLDNKYLTHTNEPQHISETGDIYIVLPKFTNGTYVLEGENDGGAKLFSFEADNSQANLRFKWSVNTNTYLKDVDFVEDVDGVQFLQIHAYTFGEEITLYFHSDSLDNTNPPQIYTSKQYEGYKNFEITAQRGTYMPNAIFAGDFHAESIIIDETDFNDVNIAYNICLPTCYDVYGCPVGYTSGNPNQYITNCVDANNNKGLKWQSATNVIQECNATLVDSNAIASYNGTALDCDECTIYPISELNECTTVHGTITTDNAVVCSNFNTTNVTDIAEDVDAGICAELLLNDPKRASDCCFFTPTGSLCNGKPVVYNCECDVLETTDNINIDEATFDKLTVNCAYIQELHAVTEVQQETTGDYITTRANNDSSLTSTEYSGVLVNNYDGCNVAGIVVDCTGTLRVGDGSKTDTTYNNIYYADNKWYSDAELTTEITPSGQLTGWESRTETEDYIHYVNAVFSVVSFTDYQPVLTRDESVNMTDKALIQWDATNNCATTIAAPTCDESTLAYNATNCCYYWQEKQPGSLIFDTVACYNAYAATTNVPNGTAVYIRCESDYLMGDDQ